MEEVPKPSVPPKDPKISFATTILYPPFSTSKLDGAEEAGGEAHDDDDDGEEDENEDDDDKKAEGERIRSPESSI